MTSKKQLADEMAQANAVANQQIAYNKKEIVTSRNYNLRIGRNAVKFKKND